MITLTQKPVNTMKPSSTKVQITELFGEMREATPQEQEGVKLYINQISKHKSEFDFEEEFEDIDQVR